ncbi:inositol 1,4,5-trisphosphate-sensitive calcium-release channel [Aureococcus anophagefferens]|nr:inositol 1,4,5-trisphosphate-sensitive calcium-release channel [Aureococcus anophagefferens]
MKHTWSTRLWIDFLYFLIVLIVLLNVIFGIIIDTFGELRNQKGERLRKTVENCFICGLDGLTFDRASPEPGGFRRHIREDHRMWDYLNFIIFIWEQDKDEDDGLELYVREQIEHSDITWFPVGRAICLSVDGSVEDSVGEQLAAMERKLENGQVDGEARLTKNLESSVQSLHKLIENVAARTDKKFAAIQELGMQAAPARHAADAPDEPATPARDKDRGRAPKSNRDKTTDRSKSRKPRSERGKGAVDDDDGAQPTPETLYVDVHAAGGLVDTHLLGSGDPYVYVSLLCRGEKFGQTERIAMTTKPSWAQYNAIYKLPNPPHRETSSSSLYLAKVPKKLQTKEVVLAAVRQDSWALKHASDALKADKEVVLVAVQQQQLQNGRALRYASKELRADKKVVLAAVQKSGGALQYASDALKGDKEVVFAAVQQDGWALHYASDVLKAEKEVALAAVRRDGEALQYASDALRADKEIVLAAVRQDGMALVYASEALAATKEIVRAAVRQNVDAIEDVPKETLASFLDANDANEAIIAALRAELARRPDMVQVLDVDTGETTDEPAPKRARTEVTTSGIKVLAENAQATNVLLAKVKDEKRDAEEGRGAAERRAEDAEDRTKCVSCMVSDLQVCFMPCSHLCVCSGCADEIMSRGGLCPICRGPIRERLTVFISGAG